MTDTREKPKAGSAETQILVDLCLAIAAGDDSLLDELRDKVAARHEAMTQAAEGFFAEVDKQGPEFYEKHQMALDMVEGAFAEFEATLEEINASQGESLLESAYRLATNSNGLSLAMTRYEHSFLSQGSSQFAIVNLIENIGREYREGTMTDPRGFTDTCAYYKDYYQGAVQEIEQSEAKDKPGVPARREALTKILGALDKLEVLEPKDEEQKFNDPLLELSSAHHDLQASMAVYHKAEFTDGPTQAPSVNWIINVASGAREGRYPSEALSAMVNQYLEKVQAGMVQLETALKIPTDSTVLQEEVPKMRDSLETLEDALLILQAYGADPDLDPEQVDEAIDALKQGGDTLVEATDAINKYNESHGRPICIHCQTASTPGSKFCEGCQRPLPKMTGSEEFDTAALSTFQVLEGATLDEARNAVMTDVMKDLFDACEAVERADMALDDFLRKLEHHETVVSKAETDLSKFTVPEIPEEATEEDKAICQEFIDLAQDALDLLADGLDDCRMGLELLARAAMEEDPNELRQGMRLYYRGSQKLWEVKRVDTAIQRYLRGEEDPMAPEPVGEQVQLTEAAEGSLESS